MVSRHSLLDEDDHTHDNAPQITINQAYAKRFTHNKKREALHRLQELQKRGLVDSSDDDSDEDDDEDGFLPTRTQLQLFETLSKIKKKDPSIYLNDAKFFDEEDENGEEAGDVPAKERKEQKKPVYLKDALAKQLIEDGSDLQEEAPKRKAIKTYAEEQLELKNAFLSSVGEESSEEGEGGGLLKLRKKTAEELGKEQRADEEVVAEADQRSKDVEIVRRMEEYFGKDDELDENEKFLKDFLHNQGWMDEDENRIPSYDEIVGNLSEDEEELERQERFEADYNFRFEEGASSQVLGHARVVEGSVRKKDDARKRQRQNKKSRLSEEELERREELKRLKNIKKEEILQKLGKIKTIAGASVDDPNALSALGEDDLEEDFDPEEYDRKMNDAFGDDYYGAEDADANFQGYDEEDLQEPDFNVEDDLAGLPQSSDKPGKHGFAAAREVAKTIEKSSFGRREDASVQGSQSSETEGELGNPEDNFGDNLAEDESLQLKSTFKKRKKGKISFREKLAFDKQLEEYYKLDYEDRIGDLPTRFKYRQVKRNMYGLKTWEILMSDDKDLNQHVSLKKIAPYVTEEWVPRRKFHSSQKTRKKEALLQPSKKAKKSETKVSGTVDNSSSKDSLLVSSSIPNGTQGNAEIEGSKKKKRKRRRGGLGIPQSRLIAYGKISVSSKRKTN